MSAGGSERGQTEGEGETRGWALGTSEVHMTLKVIHIVGIVGIVELVGPVAHVDDMG